MKDDAKTVQARALLADAMKAVKAGDLLQARRLVREAEELKPNLAYYETHTPDKVKAEIARAEQAAKAPAKDGVKQAAMKSDPMPAEKALQPGEVKAVVKQAKAAGTAAKPVGSPQAQPAAVAPAKPAPKQRVQPTFGAF